MLQHTACVMQQLSKLYIVYRITFDFCPGLLHVHVYSGTPGSPKYGCTVEPLLNDTPDISVVRTLLYVPNMLPL